MNRKKSAEVRRSPPRAATNVETPSTSAELSRLRRRLAIFAALFALSLAAVAYVGADWYYGLPADAKAEFVGRQSCVQCHQQQNHAWQGSHHDLAMDLAKEMTVLGDFNNAELTHHGMTSRMFKRDGKFFVNTEGPDGKLADFEVQYVFGVDPLQQYMVEFDRPASMPDNEVARLQVLRISWDTRNKRWFHLDPPDVKEKLDPTDDLHWTGPAQRWNHMCADCHSTNLQKNYNVAGRQYHTTWSEIDVSCEACHGPGSLHVQLATSKSLFWDRKLGYALARLKGPSNVPQIQACAPCHSRRRVIAPGYTAGCNYYDYFSNEVLTPSAYHADGQILDEVYEYTSFLESKMYHKNVRCTDCHDPHSAQLKHTGNQVCTSCHQHPAGKYDGESHHHHKSSSAGAQCVECHMPQATYMEVDPRRDHSFRVPRPDLSVQLGTPNACTRCHLRDERLPWEKGDEGPGDRGQGTGSNSLKELIARPDLKEYADWLTGARRGDREVKARLEHIDRWANGVVDVWYGKDRKKEPHFAEALDGARRMAPDAPAKLVRLLADRNQPAVARATAALELGAFSEPGNPASEALQKALHDRDPQVREAAIRSLQPTVDERTLAGVVSVLAPALKDPARVVRTEGARFLALVGSDRLQGEERADFRSAIEECFAGGQIDNDRAVGHLSIGGLYEALGNLEQAQAEYETAIRIEPNSVGARANLANLFDQRFELAQQRATQLARSGDAFSAQREMAAVENLPAKIAELREAELGLQERDALLAPDNAAVQERTGFTRVLTRWNKEAETALLTAALLEPRNPTFLRALAEYYRSTGRAADALPLAERIVALRPDSRAYRQFADEVREQARDAVPEPPGSRPAANQNR